MTNYIVDNYEIDVHFQIADLAHDSQISSLLNFLLGKSASKLPEQSYDEPVLLGNISTNLTLPVIYDELRGLLKHNYPLFYYDDLSSNERVKIEYFKTVDPNKNSKIVFSTIDPHSQARDSVARKVDLLIDEGFGRVKELREDIGETHKHVGQNRINKKSCIGDNMCSGGMKLSSEELLRRKNKLARRHNVGMIHEQLISKYGLGGLVAEPYIHYTSNIEKQELAFNRFVYL